MYVIIHADGEGSRLRPHTEHIPKAMIPVDGKPYLEHQITNFRDRWGATNFIIAQGRCTEVIQDYFGDGSRLGVIINHQVRDYPTTGTSRPMQIALAGIPDTETVVVHAASDVYTNLDHEKFFQAHQERKAPITIHFAQVQFPYGIPKHPDNDGVFSELEEKPMVTVNTSLAIVDRNIYPLLPKTGHFLSEGLRAVGSARAYTEPGSEWLHISNAVDWKRVDTIFRERREQEEVKIDKKGNNPTHRRAA